MLFVCVNHFSLCSSFDDRALQLWCAPKNYSIQNFFSICHWSLFANSSNFPITAFLHSSPPPSCIASKYSLHRTNEQRISFETYFTMLLKKSASLGICWPFQYGKWLFARCVWRAERVFFCQSASFYYSLLVICVLCGVHLNALHNHRADFNSYSCVCVISFNVYESHKLFLQPISNLLRSFYIPLSPVHFVRCLFSSWFLPSLAPSTFLSNSLISEGFACCGFFSIATVRYPVQVVSFSFFVADIQLHPIYRTLFSLCFALPCLQSPAFLYAQLYVFLYSGQHNSCHCTRLALHFFPFCVTLFIFCIALPFLVMIFSSVPFCNGMFSSISLYMQYSRLERILLFNVRAQPGHKCIPAWLLAMSNFHLICSSSLFAAASRLRSYCHCVSLISVNHLIESVLFFLLLDDVVVLYPCRFLFLCVFLVFFYLQRFILLASECWLSYFNTFNTFIKTRLLITPDNMPLQRSHGYSLG